ncbi:MAG TPA: HD domain-containing protein [Stellaceae bacterium]|nr:HD domain-containing protein [Stellaceae bacterium]
MTALSLSERADALEHQKMRELDVIVTRSRLFALADGDLSMPMGAKLMAENPGKHMLMGDDPRLPKMPEQPTLIDFFKYRFAPGQHLLQSARHARLAGHDEKVVLACLLHDIGVLGFIRSDHGYWGAQLVEPYVDEEVSWAIRYHQSLRFFADEANGYPYPKRYVEFFGPDFTPSPLMHEAYEHARNHKWYMSARHVTINDIYAFDQTKQIQLEEFTDVIGRHFRQPKEGLGNDHSPSSHMWRTIIAPTRFL